MRRRRLDHLSPLTLIHNPKLHCQHPQLMMLPCHFRTMMIHRHWSIKNQKTLWIPSEQDTPERSFHSKCRRHLYRFLRHGRSRTCPLVMQSFRRHLGSTKLYHRHQQHMTKFYLRHLGSTRLHHSKLHRPQKLRPFRLWQSGDPAHFISRTLFRSVGDPIRCIPRLLFRPRRLHSFGGVQVSCVLRPFRRLRGKQPDPSKVSVKRPRLALAQAMSKALAKNCDWSLGVDERGPVFDETRIGATRFFSQDVRQEMRFILLQSLQRISVCCLRPWHVNGRNGRSSRQHCH